jgi:chromosome segregation ATPase
MKLWHEDGEQARITLAFDNSDYAFKGYPREIIVERRIIRGESKPRMKLSNIKGELIAVTQSEIQEKFSKFGYDPDDPGIFIEQGDLRSFYAISPSSLLERCIGLAGLREVNEKVKLTGRIFNQIENTKKERQQKILNKEGELEQYKRGHDAHLEFCKSDEELKKIELENRSIRYHKKRLESLLAQKDLQEKKDNLETYKNDLKFSKIKVNDAQNKIKEFTSELNKLEERKKNILKILDPISHKKYQKEERIIELEKLIPQLKDPNIPSTENAKMQFDKIKQELLMVYSDFEKKKVEFQLIKTQLADIESGLTLRIVPPSHKNLKQRLINAGIQTEFLVDCLEVKRGTEEFRDMLEVLLDPFKFYLVIEKKDLQKAIEILNDEEEVGVIVPDDWSPSHNTCKSAIDYLVIKEGVPKKLRDFLTYFVLSHDSRYGPKEGVFLEPSIRFHRIHLSINPKNKKPGIGEEGQKASRELAEEQKNNLQININNLNIQIKQLEQELDTAKEIIDLAEKKPYIGSYEKDLEVLKKEISELNREQENIFSDDEALRKRITELNFKIQQENQQIDKEDLPTAETKVINSEQHYQAAKTKFNDLTRQAEFLQKDCKPEYIEIYDGFSDDRLTKESRKNDSRTTEIKISVEKLEKEFTREQADADFRLFENLKSLIEEEKIALKRHEEQANQLKDEWIKAKESYKAMTIRIFSQANLIFHELYKKQDKDLDGNITPNFDATPPELDIRIKTGKRRIMVPINAEIGGPSGGERLAAIVNLIVSILKARSQLAKREPDLYQPQPFICIDEPQQDMDDPAFRSAILNFKEIMEDTQIIILTHKPLPDPEIWQLWVFLDPDRGTIGRSHRGDIHKLVDRNAS